MKKRIILPLLVLVFALVLSLAFAACEQTPPADQSGTQQTEPSGDDPTPPDGGGEEQEDPDTQPEDPDGPGKDPGDEDEGPETPDEPEEVTPMMYDYKIVYGTFAADGTDKVRSRSANSLAVHKTGAFTYGVMEATVQLSGTPADSGIVFALTESSASTYWESGASYYFFFVSRSGTAYLGRVLNGWSVCAEKRIEDFDAAGTYRLRIERDDTGISCYVDDEFYMLYTETTPLSGDKYGLRAGTADVRYSDVEVTASETPAGVPSEEYDILSGGLNVTGLGVRATAATVALHKTAAFTDGTLTLSLAPINSADNSVIFCADDEAKSYYALTFTAGRYVELAKVVNGARTRLQRGKLSASYQTGSTYPVTIVKEGGSIHCYVALSSRQTLCYAAYTDSEPLTGTRAGIMTGGAGTICSAMNVSAQTDTRTAEVLLFGHSYMELWRNYKTDLSEYSSIDNIGIGGSVASHWEEMIEQIVSYSPSIGIYMIGINDITAGYTPAAIADSVETVLLALHARLPEAEFVLVGINHCPNKTQLADNISETNALMRNLAASYDWILFAETEYLFCATDGDPSSVIASDFSDGLHITAASYVTLAGVIRNAIAGLDQPALDEDLAEETLAAARQGLLDSISVWSQDAFTAQQWESARPHYESAVAKIMACTTREQLDAVDLTQEIAALEALPNRADILTDELIDPSFGIRRAANDWTKTTDGAIRMHDFNYIIDNSAQGSRMEAVFRMSNNTGNIVTAGIVLRVSVTAGKGLNGYLINFVYPANYMQIYYMNNAYNTNGSASVIKYIGGLVYSGDVVNTDFYVRTEGDMLYLCTYEQYRTSGITRAVAVDLTYGGQFEVYDAGYFGIISWTRDVSYDLTVSHLVVGSAAAVHAQNVQALPADFKRT